MQKLNIDLSFKASYYKIGNIDSDTKKVWLIFHGYGQLADEFAHSFSSLIEENTCLIFPQGLSKFYLKGTNKKIGANWMTAHDRESDIENYIHYLNKLYFQEINPYSKQILLNVLGFSQGGHTSSRWIYRAGIKYNKLILWGTSLANEIDGTIVMRSFSNGKNIVILGDSDRYITEEQLQIVRSRYSKIGFKYELVEYNGGHEIYPEILKLQI